MAVLASKGLIERPAFSGLCRNHPLPRLGFAWSGSAPRARCLGVRRPACRPQPEKRRATRQAVAQVFNLRTLSGSSVPEGRAPGQQAALASGRRPRFAGLDGSPGPSLAGVRVNEHDQSFPWPDVALAAGLLLLP